MASKLKLTELLYPTSTTAAITINSDDTVTFGAPTTTITNLSATSITDSGNLTFTGTGNRITGDFSNATIASRVLLQSSTTNGQSALGLLPNGTSTQTQYIAFNSTDPANSSYIQALISATEARINSGQLGTGTNLPMTFYTGGSERVRIDTSGNVGIGTATPSYKLHVTGGSVFTSLTNSYYCYTSDFGMGTPDSDGLQIFAGATNSIRFGNRISGTYSEHARIDSSGRLLVGTAAASNTNGVKITKGGAVGGGIIELMKTGSGITNGLLNYYQTTYVGGINFDNTSTSFPTSSDVRLKKDIVDAPSATQKIDNIRIVSHGWKHDDAVVEFGVIAQELLPVAPNAVMQGDDGKEVVTTWSVDYSKLVPLLIKAHQEQQALITQLQADVATLKGAA